MSIKDIVMPGDSCKRCGGPKLDLSRVFCFQCVRAWLMKRPMMWKRLKS